MVGSKKTDGLDPRIEGLLNAEALEKMRKSGFTGSLEVGWKNGSVRHFSLNTSLEWGATRRRNCIEFDG